MARGIVLVLSLVLIASQTVSSVPNQHAYPSPCPDVHEGYDMPWLIPVYCQIVEEDDPVGQSGSAEPEFHSNGWMQFLFPPELIVLNVLFPMR